LELIAPVAIGLNPYIGTFLLAAFAAFTGRLPESELTAAVPQTALVGLVFVSGAAAAGELVLGKFVRFAPRARRVSQIVAPISAGLWAAALEQSELPSPVVAVGAAVLAWAVSATLTALAARASRSPLWVGLGHIPILMAAATASACIIPLALARPSFSAQLAIGSLVVLALAAFVGWRPGGAPATPAPRGIGIIGRSPSR
jgi:hypothetical protein